MSARRLLNVVHTMLVESHGPDAVEEMLEGTDPAADRAARLRQLRALGVEVA